MCLVPLTSRHASGRQPDLIRFFDTVKGSQDLPGSPQSAAGPIEASPALRGEDAIAQNARAPFVALGPAARPFRFSGPAHERISARACLAAAMVYEAGDDAIGQLAVGQVILNRVRHPAFPASVCGVVTQGSDRATGCQFTFTCDGSLARNIALPARARALAHADLMLGGMVFAGVGLATHYHTIGVYPWWSPRLEKIARVGSHVFFRWPDLWGSSRMFAANRHAPEPSAALFTRFGSLPGEGSPAADLSETQIASGSRGGVGKAPAGFAHKLPEGSHTAGVASLAPALAIPNSRRLLGVDIGGELRQPLTSTAPALIGVRLLRMFPGEGVFYLQLMPGSTTAARKRVAEQLCGGRTECQVYGWWTADAAPKAAHLDATSRATLAFTFARHADTDARSRPPSAIAM